MMSLLFRGLTYLIPSPFFEGVCLQLDGTPCGRCAILTGFFGVTGAAGFGAVRGAALGAGVDLGFGVFFDVKTWPWNKLVYGVSVKLPCR